MIQTARIGTRELPVEVNPQTGRARAVGGGVGGGAIERDSPAAAQRGARASLAEERSTFDSVAPGSARNRRNSRELANPAFSPYRSKTEARFAQHLGQLKQAREIKDWWHEPASLRLEEAAPGRRRKRHTPDFWVERNDGSLKIVAVKGHHANLRDSLTIIRWAAQRYTFARWVVVRWVDGQWVEGVVS